MTIERVYDETDGWWPSDDGVYRYGLWRCWDPTLPPLVATLCNPSTATDEDPDQTVSKLCGFARRWHRGGVCVSNLSAFRSRDAKVMARHMETGPRNHAALTMAVALAAAHGVEVMAAWGGVAKKNVPAYTVQVDRFVEIVRAAGVPLRAFKIAGDGTPYHPLMLGYGEPPVAWSWGRR